MAGISLPQKNKMTFIEINGRILDYNIYKKDCKILQRLIEEDLKVLLETYGFDKKKNKFVNLDYSMEIKLSCKTKIKPNQIV